MLVRSDKIEMQANSNKPSRNRSVHLPGEFCQPLRWPAKALSEMRIHSCTIRRVGVGTRPSPEPETSGASGPLRLEGPVLHVRLDRRILELPANEPWHGREPTRLRVSLETARELKTKMGRKAAVIIADTG